MSEEAIRNIDGSPFKPTPALSPAACRQARALVGWSQQDLGSRAGLSIGTICNFEVGRGGLRAANMALIVGAFERVGIIITTRGHVSLRPLRAAAD